MAKYKDAQGNITEVGNPELNPDLIAGKTLVPEGAPETPQTSPAPQVPETPQGTTPETPPAPPTPQAPQTPDQNVQTYIVKPGDNLSQIAKNYGVSVADISGYSSGNPNLIRPGETLTIGKAVTPSAVAPAPLAGGKTTAKVPGAPETPEVPEEPQKDRIAAMLEKYGISLPDPTGNPITSFANTYKSLLESIGVPTVKSRIESTIQEQDKVQTELNEKITEVNDNPWLSASSKKSRIDGLNTKYEPRLTRLTNLQKLYESLYNQGLDEAQYIASQAHQDVTSNQNLAFKIIDLVTKEEEAKAKLKKDTQVVEIGGRKVLVDIQTGETIKDLGVGETGLEGPTSYQEWVLAGKPGTYADYLKESNIKAPTSAQQTVGTYAARLEQSEPIITNLENTLVKMNPLVWETQRKLPTYLQSDEFKQFDQASRNFINATLRRESGAVISPSEFDNAYRQYLPRPNDDETTLKNKRENRKLVSASFKSAAGSAYQSVEDLLGGGTTDIQPSSADIDYINALKKGGKI